MGNIQCTEFYELNKSNIYPPVDWPSLFPQVTLSILQPYKFHCYLTQEDGQVVDARAQSVL